MRILFVLLPFLAIFKNVNSAMSEAQVQSAAKLMRNVCQPKSKITNDQFNAIHHGNFVKDKEIMSYIECVLRTAQIMKDGELNYEFLKVQLSTLPTDRVEPALITAEHCKDSPTSSDKHEAAYQFYKCFYEDNPKNSFLP